MIFSYWSLLTTSGTMANVAARKKGRQKLITSANPNSSPAGNDT
ncbi:hypothetical protein swp_4672 [Shewanella piezotolerans WP3]|uniref:Uncharacterized protein n=1 Tax=Shewanella piezotolerans (strain WP3 / JCM 13877) TaxID=225849 RepID=B8CTR5_SHEPW|nr:hypothetical protein swp_4672 [Shewanella piezotolerans WP3]